VLFLTINLFTLFLCSICVLYKLVPLEVRKEKNFSTYIQRTQIIKRTNLLNKILKLRSIYNEACLTSNWQPFYCTSVPQADKCLVANLRHPFHLWVPIVDFPKNYKVTFKVILNYFKENIIINS